MAAGSAVSGGADGVDVGGGAGFVEAERVGGGVLGGTANHGAGDWGGASDFGHGNGGRKFATKFQSGSVRVADGVDDFLTAEAGDGNFHGRI